MKNIETAKKTILSFFYGHRLIFGGGDADGALEFQREIIGRGISAGISDSGNLKTVALQHFLRFFDS